jgi:hypothetical protein
MEWKSLLEAGSIANLPKILCGPILRKVNETSVSVFIVLKEDIPVKLSVYDNDGPNYKNTGPMATSLGPQGANYTNAKKIGENLYRNVEPMLNPNIKKGRNFLKISILRPLIVARPIPLKLYGIR